MSDEEIDPEVLADLHLRAATEREPTRMRDMPTWKPAAIVDHVPCRNRCGRVVEWTDEAEHAFETWNRILLAKRDAPLDKTRIVFCDACRMSGVQPGADRNRKQHEMLRERIRYLKQSANPDGETKVIDEIKKLGHPDVPGLLEALRQKREAKSGGRRAKTTEVTA